MIIGGCSTVLAMVFCNEQLQASDNLSGKAFRHDCAACHCH